MFRNKDQTSRTLNLGRALPFFITSFGFPHGRQYGQSLKKSIVRIFFRGMTLNCILLYAGSYTRSFTFYNVANSMYIVLVHF